MSALLQLVIDICLFRKGPQHIPHSPALLYLTIVVYGIASYLLLGVSTGFHGSVLQLPVEILLMYGFAWGTLKMGNRLARLCQTATALFATDTLISLGVTLFIGLMPEGQPSLLYSVLILLLMLWHWLITGHIYRHALSTSFVFGLCLALIYIIGSYRIMALLFTVT